MKKGSVHSGCVNFNSSLIITELMNENHLYVEEIFESEEEFFEKYKEWIPRFIIRKNASLWIKSHMTSKQKLSRFKDRLSHRTWTHFMIQRYDNKLYVYSHNQDHVDKYFVNFASIRKSISASQNRDYILRDGNTKFNFKEDVSYLIKYLQSLKHQTYCDDEYIKEIKSLNNCFKGQYDFITEYKKKKWKKKH